MSQLETALKAHLAHREPREVRRADVHAYASEALACSRQVAFRMFEDAAVEGEKFGMATLVAFAIGNFFHEVIQGLMAQVFPGFVKETIWDLEAISGRADGFYQLGASGVAVEIKTMSAWSFNKAMKNGRPHAEHVMQASLSAKALGASLVHIVYLNKAARPGEPAFADWLMAYDADATDIEEERLGLVVASVKAGVLPEPIFEGEVIENPAKMKWPCTYCHWKDLCSALGPGELQYRLGPIPLLVEDPLTSVEVANMLPAP